MLKPIEFTSKELIIIQDALCVFCGWPPGTFKPGENIHIDCLIEQVRIIANKLGASMNLHFDFETGVVHKIS